jgi:predicted nucleic acid-binding protein
MKYLLDSNIIIYYLNGDRDIYDFIEKHKSISAISLITYYEVLNYDFSEQEELLVREFLDEFEVLSVSRNIINKALKNRKSKKIKMADNFILATAQIFGLDIVTRNIKDFSFFTDKLLNPFEGL